MFHEILFFLWTYFLGFSFNKYSINTVLGTGNIRYWLTKTVLDKYPKWQRNCQRKIRFSKNINIKIELQIKLQDQEKAFHSIVLLNDSKQTKNKILICRDSLNRRGHSYHSPKVCCIEQKPEDMLFPKQSPRLNFALISLLKIYNANLHTKGSK